MNEDKVEEAGAAAQETEPKLQWKRKQTFLAQDYVLDYQVDGDTRSYRVGMSWYTKDGTMKVHGPMMLSRASNKPMVDPIPLAAGVAGLNHLAGLINYLREASEVARQKQAQQQQPEAAPTTSPDGFPNTEG